MTSATQSARPLNWGIYKGASPPCSFTQEDKVKRLGEEAAKPKRLRYKPLK